MLKRAVTAIILVGYAFAMLYLGTAVHYGFLDALIMSFAFVGTYEMYHTFRKSEYKNSWGGAAVVVRRDISFMVFFRLQGHTDCTESFNMSCAGGVHVQSGKGTERPACDDIFADLSDGARVACVRAVERVSVRRHVCDIVCDFPSRVFGYVCVSCWKHFGEKETLSVDIAEKDRRGRDRRITGQRFVRGNVLPAV